PAAAPGRPLPRTRRVVRSCGHTGPSDPADATASSDPAAAPPRHPVRASAARQVRALLVPARTGGEGFAARQVHLGGGPGGDRETHRELLAVQLPADLGGAVGREV